MESKCPHCQTSISPDQKFCSNCGKEIVHEGSSTESNPLLKPCPVCKKEIGLTAKTCPHCGSKLHKSKMHLLFKSKIARAIMILVGLQLLSSLLLSEGSWRISQLTTIMSFVLTAVYILRVYKGDKKNKVFVLSQSVLAICALIACYIYIRNNQEERISPQIIKDGISRYWDKMTVEYGKYRYGLLKTSDNPNDDLTLIRFDKERQIELLYTYKFVGFFEGFTLSNFIEYPVKVKIPPYQFSHKNSSYPYYGDLYDWNTISSEILSGKYSEGYGESYLVVGKGFQPITHDTTVIINLLKAMRQFER